MGKARGKGESITITNDKGRLTQDEIDRMIKEAEQFADEDKKVKERVDAKNAFENYTHSMRVTVEGSGDNKGLSEKLDDEEKEKIKEAEAVCAPIISKHYGGAGAGAGDDEEEE